MYVSEYQRAARTTAIYPAAAGIYYPALGLAGELGELANKAKKIIRGDYLFESKVDDFRKETGDVLWYVAAVASDCGLDLRKTAESADVGEYLEGDLYSTLLVMQHAAGLICLIAEQTRTHGMNEHRRALIDEQLKTILVYASRLCLLLGTDLGTVCKDNIQKLFKRKETGTIKGDGDNREQTAGSADPPATCGTACGGEDTPQTMYRLQSMNGAGEWYDTGDFFPNSLDAAKRCLRTTKDNNPGRGFRVMDNTGTIRAFVLEDEYFKGELVSRMPDGNGNSKAAEDLFPRKAA